MNKLRYTLMPASLIQTGDVLMRYIAGVETEVGRVTSTRLTRGAYVIDWEQVNGTPRCYTVSPTYAFWVRRDV